MNPIGTITLIRTRRRAEKTMWKGRYIMDPDKIVCNCLGVTNGTIKEAVDSGASTLEEVQEITEAGTICGACIDDVQHLVESLVRERDS